VGVIQTGCRLVSGDYRIGETVVSLSARRPHEALYVPSFCINCFISFNLRLIVQEHAQQ